MSRVDLEFSALRMQAHQFSARLDKLEHQLDSVLKSLEELKSNQLAEVRKILDGVS